MVGDTCPHPSGVVAFMYLYESTPGGVGLRSCIPGKWGYPDVPLHFQVGSLDSLALDLGPVKPSVSSGSSGNAPKLCKNVSGGGVDIG